jgi:ADP-ribosylation factor protein 1
MWKHYCQDTQGLIFVIDSSDISRIGEAKEELYNILKENSLAKASVLIIANKQDVPHAMNVEELSQRLELSTMKHPHHIQAAVATSGKGIEQGLSWLVEQVKKFAK